MKNIYAHIVKKAKAKRKLFCVLVDPDKFSEAVIHECNKYDVDFFFVGGSRVKPADFKKAVQYIKQHSAIPLVIFPGSDDQFSDKADAILFLSLLSGRNPEYLIGKQVKSALRIRQSGVECISTGYLLISGGKNSATQKVTGTRPIAVTDKDQVISTALAGELLGMKIIYLEAGSGASIALPAALIKQVKKHLRVPLVVGGGIDSKQKAAQALRAGADMIVVGNAIENNLFLIKEISSLFK